MKVYVAEQPESCLDCKFCNKENYCCWLMQKDAREYRDDCPLQSISDYTKQVRKEVCEEIREIAKKLARPTTEYDDGPFDCDIDAIELDHLLIWLGNGEIDLIKNYLDQIKGEK